MMDARAIGARPRALVAAAAAAALFGCGGSPLTSARIEAALERSFANLVELQVSRLGLAPMRAPDFAVTAVCRRQAPGNRADAGSGDWVCTVVWQGPNRQTLRDTYDLFVATDGCYAATAEGEGLGGPTLKTTDGRSIKNLLYAFEGCFDPQG